MGYNPWGRKESDMTERLHFHFYVFLKKIFICLFLVVLGLHCYAWALSSCGESGLTSGCGTWASHCGGLSCCGAWALGHVGIGNYCRGTQ